MYRRRQLQNINWDAFQTDEFLASFRKLKNTESLSSYASPPPPPPPLLSLSLSLFLSQCLCLSVCLPFSLLSLSLSLCFCLSISLSVEVWERYFFLGLICYVGTHSYSLLLPFLTPRLPSCWWTHKGHLTVNLLSGIVPPSLHSAPCWAPSRFALCDHIAIVCGSVGRCKVVAVKAMPS